MPGVRWDGAAGGPAVDPTEGVGEELRPGEGAAGSGLGDLIAAHPERAIAIPTTAHIILRVDVFPKRRISVEATEPAQLIDSPNEPPDRTATAFDRYRIRSESPRRRPDPGIGLVELGEQRPAALQVVGAGQVR